MKVSIITVVYNSVETLEECINCVINQRYNNIEHVIIDGGSLDGTLSIIEKYKDKISNWLSERDNGIYDAMNKGINIATGDIIGILNSDDIYKNEYVIKSVAELLENNDIDTCYGDLLYVNKYNVNKIIRRWRSGEFSKKKFKMGWMPPHPTFFVRKDIYKKYGLFNLSFPLAADYELMLRFLYKYNVSTAYIPKPLVKMRVGGFSNPGIRITSQAIIENYKAWKVNGLEVNPIAFILKPLLKISQYIN